MSSISGITSGQIAQITLSTNASSQSILSKLSESINQGDAQGAQSALAQLQKVQSSLAKVTGKAVNSQLTTDMNTLSKALSSNDMSSAKTALASVSSDLKQSGSQMTSLVNAIVQDKVSLISALFGDDSSSSSSSLLGSSSSSNGSDWISNLLSLQSNQMLAKYENSVNSSTSGKSSTTSGASSTSSVDTKA